MEQEHRVLHSGLKSWAFGAGPTTRWLKFRVALLWWPRFASLDPGCDYCTHQPCCGGIPHTRQRKTGADASSGQSSSAKRGGLAADVNSGLIFLHKNKPRNVLMFLSSGGKIYPTLLLFLTKGRYPFVLECQTSLSCRLLRLEVEITEIM